jgi:hypothetical protein
VSHQRGYHRIAKHSRHSPISRWVYLGLAALVSAAMLPWVGIATRAAAADYTTPVRAAFWYDGSFRHATDHYKPAFGTSYDDTNPTHVAAEMAGVKHAGMQAVITSWWGQGQHNEQVRFPILRDTATAQGLGLIPYYEPEGQANQSVAQIQADLTHLAQYATVRIGGKPVIFVYNARSDTSNCATVSKWKTATAGFTTWYVNLKVFGGFASCPDQPSSWHQYGPAVAESIHLPWSFNISPGFWHYQETAPRLARDPARWAANVAHMAASGAQWQLVTSWNEWGEGTAVEPSPSWQSGSGWGTYVDELHRQLVDGASPPSPTPTASLSPSSSPSPTASPSTSPSSSPSPSPTVTSSPTPSPSTTTASPSPTTSPTASPSPVPTGTLPVPDHIVVVIFENRDRTQIVGNPDALWFNAQLSRGAYLSSSVAITHPSLPNYLALWSGSTQGVTDDGCSYSFTTPSLGQQLSSAGLSWRGYAENLPAAGSTVCTASGGYAKKHDPWAYWPADAAGGTPYTAWPADFSQLPKVSFVIPNLCDDMHDCSVATGDAWAMAHLDAYRVWAMTHNSLLVITFDENDGSSGNHIYTVIEGQHVTIGSFAEAVNHYRVLRTVEALCGLPGIGNAAASTPIRDIWN